jgi:hypothetical protein
MKLFSLNFDTLILRFYLLMAIIIGAFFIGQTWLAFLALPVFFSAMTGMKFTMPRIHWVRKGHTQKAKNTVLGQHAH